MSPHRLLALFVLGLTLLSLSPAHAGNRNPNCGGPTQRECRLWEAVPSCDRGLAAQGGRCHQCGANGQILCPITVQLKSCDSGLMAQRGRCRPCGGAGERECPVTVQVPSCDSGLMAHRGRCGPCGAAGERECPVTVQVPSCDRDHVAVGGRCQPCGDLGDRACAITNGRRCRPGTITSGILGLGDTCIADPASAPPKPSRATVMQAYERARADHPNVEAQLASMLPANSGGVPIAPTLERPQEWREMEAALGRDRGDFDTATFTSFINVAFLGGFTHGWGVAEGPNAADLAAYNDAGRPEDEPPELRCVHLFENTPSLGLQAEINGGIEVGLFKGAYDALNGWDVTLTVGGAAVQGGAYSWHWSIQDDGSLDFAGVTLAQLGGLGLDASIEVGHSFTQEEHRGEPAQCRS